MDIHILLFFLLFSVRTARTAGLPGGHSVFTDKNPQRETIGAAEGFCPSILAAFSHARTVSRNSHGVSPVAALRKAFSGGVRGR
jgi:hypothetical protein